MALVVPSVFEAIDKFSAPVRRMEKTSMSFAEKTSKAFVRLDRRVSSFGRSIKDTLGNFGLFIGASAGIGVIRDAIKIIGDYEQANANLASVLGISIKETDKLQESSKRLGATTAFTAAEVAGLQTEFAKLGFLPEEILGATEATLSLAAATKTDLAQAASQVGAAIRAFGMNANEAQRVADVFAASTSKSALDMEKLNTSMSTIAPVASQFGFKIESATALLGKLSDAGFDASTAATSTRNIILNLADSNGKLARSLGRPVNTLPDLVSGLIELREKGVDLAGMLELTDKRSVAAFATFLESAEGILILNESLERAGGTAEVMAKKQLDTLQGRMTILRSAYEGFILSMDEGNGAFSMAIKRVLDVTTEVLSLASGSALAREELSSQALVVRDLAEKVFMALKVIKWLAISYVKLKLLIFTVRAATVAYNVVVGITNALQGKSLVLSRHNALALKAHLAITKAATIAQKAFNLVMRLNPIGLILTGLVALGFAIKSMIDNWDKWGRIVALVTGPLGWIVFLAKELYDNWSRVTSSFERGGILGALKEIKLILVEGLIKAFDAMPDKIKVIGANILKWILKPIEWVLLAMSKIGLGGDALSLLQKVQQANQSFIDRNTEGGEKNLVNLQATQNRINVERQERITRGELGININSNGGAGVRVDESGLMGIPVSTQQTFAFQ